MKEAIRQALLPALSLLLAASLLFWGVGNAVINSMPPWRDSVGNFNHTEKITGTYLVEQSAAQEDTLLIFGSSELRTTEISTHPANFFAGKRAGFQVDLIGRGSCQSLIHALELAASGDSLAGKKIVLITSPQSFVPEGIAPDLFYANFSYEQYLAALEDEDLSDEVKATLSARVAELLAAYEQTDGTSPVDPAIQALAEHRASPTPLSAVCNVLMTPYYALDRYLLELRNMADSRPVLAAGVDTAAPEEMALIDWQAEEQAAVVQAERMATNNTFGMEDDYYTTYIGSRLERQKDRDAELDYSSSREYEDLRLLFEICNEKGIEPLFIHVPLHGAWSDYTGFTEDRRSEYYENVRAIAAEYVIEILDLTGYEYEPYFMCDTMHLGWKGWLLVDRALIGFYYGG